MIVLVPIGPVPMDLLNWLTSRLGKLINSQIKIGNALPLPRNGYEQTRKQYMASSCMNLLHHVTCPEGERLVGVIDMDCYSPGLNYIFGQAVINGREAFVSIPRLRQSFYGLPDDNATFRERTLKEVMHELGHTWGLGHCSNNDCVMFFSNSLEDTDHKEFEYCSYCAHQLNR